ncbi:MAG: prepilin peptidase [Coriobacteriia bacterium]
MPQPFFFAMMGLLGLVFGSFANVVIWRFPRGESLSTPASHCPSCDTPINWYDNVPVLSWLLLRGRCRSCDARISRRYPVIELASASLAIAAAVRFGVSWRSVFAAAFFYLLLVLSAIDLDHMRLPNALVAVMAGIGCAGVLLSAVTGIPVVPFVGSFADRPWWQPAMLAASGVLLGGGVTLLISLLYSAIRGKSGLGMGDVKLLGAVGLFVGPYVPIVLFVGSVVGAVWGVLAHRGSAEGMQGRIPFGPFLALGAMFTVIWGESALSWYLKLVGLG